MINNAHNMEELQDHAQRLIDRNWIDKVIVVADHAEATLRHFGLTRDEFGVGYVYSISELVSLRLCETDYLLHFSGDSMPIAPVCWIEQAISLMTSDPRVKVANLTWQSNYQQAKAESSEETENFYLGFGFSDQCYFVHVPTFQQRIYGEWNSASQRYPAYGGELFEKRVDSWMRNHGYLRATYRHGAYWHGQT